MPFHAQTKIQEKQKINEVDILGITRELTTWR